MIKELLNERQREIAIEVCNNILSELVTPEYIVESLDKLYGIIDMIMPDDYIYSHLPTENSILIDDILGMDSISDEEKQEAIHRLIILDREEFITLAKDLLAKIESDKTEAVERGYCPELVKRGSDEEYDDEYEE
jgi:hypothetical protein